MSNINIGDRVRTNKLGNGTVVETGFHENEPGTLIYKIKLDDTKLPDSIAHFMDQESDGCWTFRIKSLVKLKNFKFIFITKPIIIEALNEDEASILFVKYLTKINMIDCLGEDS
ncbi:hypothetical protein D3C87_76040 [compost metagenome]